MGFYSIMRLPDLDFLSLRSAWPSWGTTGECVPVLRERNGKSPQEMPGMENLCTSVPALMFFSPSASKNNQLYQSISLLCVHTSGFFSLRRHCRRFTKSVKEEKALGYVAANNRQRFLAQSARLGPT